MAPQTITETLLRWLRSPTPESVAASAATWDEGDWLEARLSAQVHGVAPLLASRLDRSGGLEAVAPSFREYITRQYTLNRLRSRRLLDRLHTILERADDVGIAVVPLKGSQLLGRLYDDPAERPMADLDLLVAPAEEEALVRIVADLGYRFESDRAGHRIYNAEDAVASREGEHPDNPIQVEVHTEVELRFPGVLHDVSHEAWREGIRGFDRFRNALTLPPAALLLQVAAHGAKHMVSASFRSIHLHDIALLAGQLDTAGWRSVAEGARRLELAPYLLGPLTLAREHLGAPIPADLLARLEGKTPARVGRLLRRTGPDRVSAIGTGLALRYRAGKTEDRWTPVLLVLNQMLVQQSTLLGIQLHWVVRRRDRLRVAREIFLPGAETIRVWYPNIADWRGGVAAYVVHYVGLLVYPVARLLGVSPNDRRLMLRAFGRRARKHPAGVG